MSIKKVIWIAWERHQRTLSLSKFLKSELYIYESDSPRLIKYISLSVKTIKTLLEKRPSVLIVQNPSIVLSFLVCFLKPIFGYYLIVDTHNAGISPEDKILGMLKFLNKYIVKNSNLTIVTNSNLASIVNSYSGCSFVLPDKIPELNVDVINKEIIGKDVVVVLISTFGVDEPYSEFLKCSEILSNTIKLFVTGKLTKVENDVYEKYKNTVRFTDFLPERDYFNLLAKADIVVDLTTREDCLVCGAYEAVSLGKPLVLSDTTALRSYFYKGVVFTNNSADDISASIMKCVNNIECLRSDMSALKSELSQSWAKMGNSLIAHIKSNSMKK